jgi:hypothetical protein
VHYNKYISHYSYLLLNPNSKKEGFLRCKSYFGHLPQGRSLTVLQIPNKSFCTLPTKQRWTNIALYNIDHRIWFPGYQKNMNDVYKETGERAWFYIITCSFSSKISKQLLCYLFVYICFIRICPYFFLLVEKISIKIYLRHVFPYGLTIYRARHFFAVSCVEHFPLFLYFIRLLRKKEFWPILFLNNF